MDRPTDLNRISGFYFLFFGAVGCLFPYLNLYYQRAGLTGWQIGLVVALASMTSQLAAPLWGLLSDSRALRRRLLSVAVGGCIVAALLISAGNSLGWFAVLAVGFSFFMAPTQPLADSTALEVGGASNRSYGSLRAWGTVGFILATLAVGRWMETAGIKVMFAGYALLMLGCLILSLRFPAGREGWSGPAARGLRILLADRVFLLVLISVFILSAAIRAADSFFSLYLDGMGASEGAVGLSWAIGAMTEAPVIFLSGALLRRMGARGLLLFGCGTYALRWLLYAYATSPGPVLAIQLLHGFSYGPYLVGGVVFAGERAPKGLGATAQGLYTGTTMGIAGFAGALIGGWLYDAVGVANLFRICSLAAVLALLLMLLPTRTGPAAVAAE